MAILLMYKTEIFTLNIRCLTTYISQHFVRHAYVFNVRKELC